MMYGKKIFELEQKITTGLFEINSLSLSTLVTPFSEDLERERLENKERVKGRLERFLQWLLGDIRCPLFVAPW